MQYTITEIGNGPWCDPIAAKDIDAALEIVRNDLKQSNPVDYVDGWNAGDEFPEVDVRIEQVGTNVEITRTLQVGECS